MNDFQIVDVIKRHGTEIYIMSQSDWENFRKKLKADYPELYEIFKREMNFDLTPVSYKGEEIED